MSAGVTLWEDVVGDSGKAPTDSELDAFYRAAKVEALREAADAWAGPTDGPAVSAGYVAHSLRARADEIVRGE